MIFNVNTTDKKLDILNSEGAILALYSKKEEPFILEALLSQNRGRVLFSIGQNALKDYANSRVTLNELFMQSEDVLVILVDKKENKLTFKENVQGKLIFGNQFYREIATGMKSERFRKKFTNG